MDNSIIIEPPRDPSSAVIWLHGLGANGNDFVSAIEYLGLADDHGTRFIFPNAKIQPVSVNGGMPMRSWYDIFSSDIDRKIDFIGVRESARRIAEIVDAQIFHGIRSEKIFLIGFSQGGAVAVYSAIISKVKLGGVVAMSTYWIGNKNSEHIPFAPNTDLNFLVAHGTQDSIVPYKLGINLNQILCDFGYRSSFYSYEMDHSVVPEELADIGRWLSSF